MSEKIKPGPKFDDSKYNSHPNGEIPESPVADASDTRSTANTYWDSALSARLGSTTTMEDDLQCSPEALDEDIAAISRILQRTRTRRNSLSRTCRMPPEILARCFSFLQHVSYKSNGYYDAYMSSDWLNVLRVCGHWRQVTLSTPALWTDIQLDFGVAWVTQMLLLSKSAPISVRYSGDTASLETDNLMQAILRDHMSHMRKLDLHYCDSALIEQLDIPAPLLESLCIEQNDSPICSLPSRPFGNRAPCLRELSLDNVVIPEEAAPILTNLVTLQMDLGPLDEHPMRPSGSSLIYILSHATRLKNLSLQGVLPIHVDNAPMSPETKAVRLPHLQNLHVRESTAGCTFLMKHLDLPPLASFSFQASGNRDGSLRIEQSDALLSAIAPHTRNCRAQPRTLLIEHNKDLRTMDLKVWGWSEFRDWREKVYSPYEIYRLPFNITPAIEAWVAYPSGTKPSSGSFVILQNHFDLGELRTLNVPDRSLRTTQRWIDTLAPAKKLCTLRFHGTTCASSFFTALVSSCSGGGPLPTPDDQVDNGDIFLPELVSLDLIHVDFLRIVDTENGKNLFSLVVDVLKKRQRLGHPVLRMDLGHRYCSFLPEHVVQLKNLVAELDHGTPLDENDILDKDKKEEET